jgi:hypothetical protein
VARSPDEAHALVPELLELTDQAVEVRAQLTEAVRGAVPARPADVKALEARFADLLDRITGLDVQLKGWAPLLVDVVVDLGDREVLFCWLEGDRELSWYHELELGFAGRRPLGDLERGSA